MTDISTERLIMRPFKATDINYLIHLKGSEANMAKTTVGPIDANAASFQLNQYQKQWKTRGIGVWSLTHKASGAFVGECGFVERKDMEDISLRYTLCQGWWSQGLASEAVNAAIHFGLTDGQLDKVSALALDSNTRSCRILETAAMTLVETDFIGITGFRRYQICKPQKTELAM